MKFGMVLSLGLIFQLSWASVVFPDAVGGALTLLSIHTNPGSVALRKQYPRKIDEQGTVMITPGVEGYYDQPFPVPFWEIKTMRFAVGGQYDCADLKAGYLHWGGRWEIPWREAIQFSLGLGPTLIFRESWQRQFPGQVEDEQGFWTESENFLSGYQHKWLLAGTIDLQYQFMPQWQAVWSIVPAVFIVVINSIGVRYSF